MPRKLPTDHTTKVLLGKTNIPVWERVTGKDGTSGMVNGTEMKEIGEKYIEVMTSMTEEILENMVKRLVLQIWIFLQVIVLLRQSTIIEAVVRTAMMLVGPMFH